MAQENKDKSNRRTVLKLAGAAFSGTILPTAGVAAADNADPDAERVDPSDPTSIEQFLKRVLTAESEAKARVAWEELDEKQEAAVSSKLNDEIEIIKVSSDRFSPMAQFQGDYTEEFVATLFGIRLYKYFHNIQWTFDGDSQYYVTGINSGGEGLAPLWSYEGNVSTNLDTYSTFFDSYRSGEFFHSGNGATYHAWIELRGRASGQVSVLDKDATRI